jgi:hypothetical protein
MTKRAMFLAAVKALIASEISTLAIGLLFAGINEANEWLFADCCLNGGVFLSMLRFWSAWWWFIFIALYYPIWLCFLFFFIRRFAPLGNRLAVAGVVCIFQGAMMLLGTIVTFAMASDQESAVFLASYSVLGAIMLLGGWYLASKPSIPA